MLYLPPLPDPAVINGPGHVEDSNELAAFVVELAAIAKTPIDPLRPPVPGASGHVAWHNSMVKDIGTVAAALGVTVTLPPLTVKAGDLAHVTHHNLIRKALLDINTNAWNDATGGVISNYTVDGKKMRRHTFNTSAAFVVTRAFRPFNVVAVSAGGSGGVGNPYHGGGCNGGGGGAFEKSFTLTAISYPVTVGKGVAGAFGAFEDTVFHTLTVGGASGGIDAQFRVDHGSAQPGRPGSEGGTSNGGRGGGGNDTCGGATFPGQGIRDKWGLGTAGNPGPGGSQEAAGLSENLGGAGGPGGNGVVIVDYQIGTV